MKKILCLLIISGIVVSCENHEKSYQDIGNVAFTERMSVVEIDEVESEETGVSVYRKSEYSNNNEATIERKLIKNGRITFKVDSIKSAKELIVDLVKTHKGYISSDDITKNPHRINQYMSLRIPIENFDHFLRELSKGVKEFERKEINVSDVTTRFYDLKTRLTTKKELEKRYLQILAKAKNVKEILEVEKELGALREDIESMEGRFRLLNNQISMSTIDLSFYKEISQKTNQPNQFLRSFMKGIDSVKDFVLFVISIWPFVILLTAGFFFIRRRIKRKFS